MIFTKSNYILGINCIKSLWEQVHKPHLRSPLNTFQQMIVDDGHVVGELAKKEFPKGIDLSHLKGEKAYLKTKNLLEKENVIIFEACFYTFYKGKKCLIRTDILEKKGETYNLYEVKSNGSVKEKHYHDLAFQTWVLKKNNMKVTSFLMHVNKEYIKNSSLNYFKKEKLNLDEHILLVPKNLNKFIDYIKNFKEPKHKLGGHCTNCPWKNHCWKNINNDSIENLSYLSSSLREKLENARIKYIQDIPPAFEHLLSERQKIQRQCSIHQKFHINQNKLNEKLKSLKYPLFFLDFEALSSAKPLFKDSSPHKFNIYQYSIHKLFKTRGLEHSSYLHLDTSNPDRIIAEKLIQELAFRGSIIVFNKSFEEQRINELIAKFPDLAMKLEKIKNRFWDLATIFKENIVFHHEMQGSSSLKKVLSPLVPELSYESLKISDGMKSQYYYKKLLQGTIDKKIIQDLEEYNNLDTYSMVKILETLYSIQEEEIKVAA